MKKQLLINVKRLFSEERKIKINSIKVNDVKSFGRKFSKEEIHKYLDPYGFLNKDEYEKINQAKQTNDETIKLDSQKNNPCENHKIDISKLPKEYGMKPSGPEPTRYGDWEKNGRCSDF